MAVLMTKPRRCVKMEKEIISTIIIIISAAVTYVIQYYSILSPGTILFDRYNKKEMILMKKYNRLSDMAFRIYLSGVLIICTWGILFQNTGAILSAAIFQIIYITASVAVMGLMYIRSRIYWNYLSNKTEGEPGHDNICDFLDNNNSLYEKVG